jgi:hypothetical protein
VAPIEAKILRRIFKNSPPDRRGQLSRGDGRAGHKIPRQEFGSGRRSG